MIIEKIAEIIREHIPDAMSLEVFGAADEISRFILKTYGPPF